MPEHREQQQQITFWLTLLGQASSVPHAWEVLVGGVSGHGPEDLSFLYQRADSPPDLLVILAYQQQLEKEAGIPIPLEEIQRVVVASELWTRLIHWPHYLVHASQERVAYHIQRIETLLNSVEA